MVQGRNGRKVLATVRAAAVGQVSVCSLGPDPSWAWEAKQPWGQETSLRRGEGSGPCKVGGVRVCAPPLLAPKFSPDGPYATVPVLGCSFPEESYPSLANQPSSGAKQGDVRYASEGGTVPPRGSVLSPWKPMPPWPPRPAPALGFPRLLAGPRLWSHVLGNPGFFSRESPAHSTGQERQSAWHQPSGGVNLSMGRRAQATAVGKWILKRGSLLTKGQEGPIQDKGGTAHQQEVPEWRTFSVQRYQALGTR